MARELPTTVDWFSSFRLMSNEYPRRRHNCHLRGTCGRQSNVPYTHSLAFRGVDVLVARLLNSVGRASWTLHISVIVHLDGKYIFNSQLFTKWRVINGFTVSCTFNLTNKTNGVRDRPFRFVNSFAGARATALRGVAMQFWNEIRQIPDCRWIRIRHTHAPGSVINSWITI